MQLPRTLGVLAAAACALAFAAGCGGGSDLSTNDLEQELQRQFEEQVGFDPTTEQSPIAGIECPAEIAIEEGKEFDCAVELPDGEEITAQVRLTDEEGGFSAIVPPEELRGTGLAGAGGTGNPKE